jgi:hypothetical protein
MKRNMALLGAAVFLGAAGGAFAQEKGFTVSGLFDSTVTMQAGAGDAPDFSWGVEEYANLRLQAKLRERAVFYGAFNLIAASGLPAQAAAVHSAAQAQAAVGLGTSAFVAGENYTAGMELERLYFTLNGEYLDLSAGLMRIPFGYGQVFGPSDFLNPKNILLPDARPRAVLGGTVSAYPADSLKIAAFGAAPKDPLALDGGGGLAGLSADQHWDRASLQVLYAFESPKTGSPRGIHRAGMSVKADLELGFAADLLYTANPDTGADAGGLSASFGFDYSFFEGKLYILGEYLYNGEDSSSSSKSGNIFGFSNEHYLYASALYRFSDYTNVTLGCLWGFSDLSSRPLAGLEHELFQGFILSLSLQVPLDQDTFSTGGRGELGPLPPGSPSGGRFICTVKARLRL